ncbi:MAG: dicarboxylate/amino acid:cation symporter [Candidatus Scalindua sp. AMX11]|nr:MAG: dicarboxylate/amino acid:cation symporter [Candidatus Scalindua sp.]NOG85022.1 dicarboxylate/amino acid:cation symporter [Planctomycetota bacterium]RZV93137.1 MAG: dicarboxylate/amino acid:cation symporter [Candidatus Scalindua sp. SCAELEC01]TDE66800.1 MAG: dicarboxylate/amino acid:cation symporter [Candidatus Scalindua sp. AMX11]
MVVGILFGIVVGGFLPETGKQIAFIGDFFISYLKMLVIPLVITSMIAGVTGLGDIRKLGGLGKKTILYYLATTGCSVLIGIILVVIIGPGKADTKEEQLKLRGGASLPALSYTIQGNQITFDQDLGKIRYDERYMIILGDQNSIKGTISEMRDGKTCIVRNWVKRERNSNKIVEARPETKGKGVEFDLSISDKILQKQGKTIGSTLKEVFLSLAPNNLIKAMSETKVLPIIVFAMIIGAILTTLGEPGRPVIAFFHGSNEAILKFVQLLMFIAPLGIGCLIAGKMGAAGGIEKFGLEFKKIGFYAMTVLLGLCVHALVVLPLILKIFTKRNVISYAQGASTALLTAFSTASSSATLPVTIKCSEDKNQVSPRAAAFVLPLGATINMDGTALYEAVAAIFIAQLYGIDLGIGHLIVIFLTATLAAIGAAGIPEAGLVTMVIVLEAVGLPIEGISMILMIDWFLDRCRTTVNVWGDSVGAAVIDIGIRTRLKNSTLG